MWSPRGRFWQECRACGFLASGLEPGIGAPEKHRALDEALRSASLAPIRRINFNKVLDRLAALRPGGRLSVLDVGCAHGWFLQEAAGRGHLAVGIEPDAQIASQARTVGVQVISGFFPTDLPAEVSFDVITFNDVFEHLPDLASVAQACRDRLRTDGLLAITLPSSHGILFRVARVLERLGVRGPMERLWQRGFPSPHLAYFHPEGLARFLSSHGFRECHRQELPSFSRAGLWQRLRYDRRASIVSSAFYYLALLSLGPAFRLFPSDISFQVFERGADSRRTHV